MYVNDVLCINLNQIYVCMSVFLIYLISSAFWVMLHIFSDIKSVYTLYRLYGAKITWNSAYQYCTSLNGSLARFRTGPERSIIFDKLSEKGVVM